VKSVDIKSVVISTPAVTVQRGPYKLNGWLSDPVVMSVKELRQKRQVGVNTRGSNRL
jgi:hypothetical protein